VYGVENDSLVLTSVISKKITRRERVIFFIC